MKELQWNESIVHPEKVEKKECFGQQYFTVNFGCEKTDEGWRWLSVSTPYVWDKGKLIASIIRLRYTADEVESIVNNVLQAPFDANRLNAYKAFQQWRIEAKRVAKESFEWATDHGLIDVVEENLETPALQENIPDGIVQMAQALTLAKAQALELPDELAVDVPALFPTWESRIGTKVEAGERLYHVGRLWKVLQDHTAQADWMPDTSPSLFAEVAADQEQGTIDNPIPYNGNMALEEGKYYTQGGVVYLCIRDTVNPVYADLSALVGLYVQVVE